jgi:hypothetical protein
VVRSPRIVGIKTVCTLFASIIRRMSFRNSKLTRRTKKIISTIGQMGRKGTFPDYTRVIYLEMVSKSQPNIRINAVFGFSSAFPKTYGVSINKSHKQFCSSQRQRSQPNQFINSDQRTIYNPHHSFGYHLISSNTITQR